MYFSGPHTWLYSFNETCRCVGQTDSLAAKLTFEHEGDESLDSPNPPGGVMRVGAVTVLKRWSTQRRVECDRVPASSGNFIGEA